jgi:hypothetical protein
MDAIQQAAAWRMEIYDSLPPAVRRAVASCDELLEPELHWLYSNPQDILAYIQRWNKSHADDPYLPDPNHRSPKN